MKANAPEVIYLQEPTKVRTQKMYDNDVEYIRIDVFMKRAKEAFCKATCNGCPPRSTCSSLGTCRDYDNFVKFLKEE